MGGQGQCDRLRRPVALSPSAPGRKRGQGSARSRPWVRRPLRTWAPRSFLEPRLSQMLPATRGNSLAKGGDPQSFPHEAQPKELSQDSFNLQLRFPNWCQGTPGYLSELTEVLRDISVFRGKYSNTGHLPETKQTTGPKQFTA